MKSLNSFLVVLWILFTGIFLIMGNIHLEASNNKIIFKKYELPKGGIAKINGVSTGISSIRTWSKNLKISIDTFLEDLNSSNQKQNMFAAVGYYIAALTAFVSFLAQLFSTYHQQKKY